MITARAQDNLEAQGLMLVERSKAEAFESLGIPVWMKTVKVIHRGNNYITHWVPRWANLLRDKMPSEVPVHLLEAVVRYVRDLPETKRDVSILACASAWRLGGDTAVLELLGSPP